MRAKFEDLPLKAHSLISRHLNGSDCFEMRQACCIWRDLLKYEVRIDEHTASQMLDDVKSGKSMLDFTHVRITKSPFYKRRKAEKLNELLRIIGDRVVHLICRLQNIPKNMHIFPILKIIETLEWKLCYCPSYKLTNINNCKGSDSLDSLSTLFLIENFGRYLKEVSLTEDTENIPIERWQRAVSTCNQLEKLNSYDIDYVEILKMCAFHLPATAPLKELILRSEEDFSDLLEFFYKKWVHSLEIIDLGYHSGYDVAFIASLKHLRALHTLTLFNFIDLPRFELYNAIASEINTNLKTLELADIKIDEEEIISVLENLPNLHNMRLQSCGRGVTDRTLATIFRRLTRLRDLRLMGSYDFTDAGFLGFGDTPYPINRLRGLTHLEIDSKRNITERILTEIARLKELRNIWLRDKRLYPKLLKMLSDDCCIDLRRELEEEANYAL